MPNLRGSLHQSSLSLWNNICETTARALIKSKLHLMLLLLCHLTLTDSFRLNHNQTSIATAHMQEPTVWADNHRENWLVYHHLQPPESQHAWKHPQNNMAFLSSIHKFVHMLTVLDDL